MKHTKIVATVSDLRCEVEFIKSLYDEGMNVVRMNTAHMDFDGISKVVNNTRAVSDQLAVLLDTKGPEIRTTKCDDKIVVEGGQKVKVTGNPEKMSSAECIYVSYLDMVKDVSVGNPILFDDGEIELLVESKDDDYLYCVATNNGEIGSRKSVNVPNDSINLPALTEKDRNNIIHSMSVGIDFIAHSFVRSAKDIKEIQDILDAHNSDVKIIAKIENQEGVDNIQEILEVVHGVMVARGDLGIEIPQEKIPGIQRHLIRECVKAKKPVIVATQMLHSMIKNPRPTRAEVADIANAIYYRTDAVMLSGETAYGDYPVEAVKTMASVALEAEDNKLSQNDIRIPMVDDDIDVSSYLSKQAVKSATRINTKAIVTDSNTGLTARHVAAYRGRMPIFAQCYKKSTMRHLALSYGVFATYLEEGDTRTFMTKHLDSLVADGLLSEDDLVAYLGGSFGQGGGTTFLELLKLSSLKESINK